MSDDPQDKRAAAQVKVAKTQEKVATASKVAAKSTLRMGDES